jgi:hypothetical protein
MLTLEDVFDHAYLRENRLLEPSIHTEALLLEETSMRVDAVTESRRLCTELDQLVDHATGMLERYDHLNTLCTHLKTYGLDQSTLHLFNTDAVFQTLHIELPALESLGSYEYQEQLQAAQENMLELFQTAIDYVNQLWEKLKNWFARFVNFWMIRHMWYKRRQEKIIRGLRNINIEFISSHRDELASVPLPVDPDLVFDFTSITGLWQTLSDALTSNNPADKSFEKLLRSDADPKQASEWFKDERSMAEIRRSFAKVKGIDNHGIVEATLSDIADRIKAKTSDLKYPELFTQLTVENSQILNQINLLKKHTSATLDAYDMFHRGAYARIQENLAACQQIARKYQFHHTQQQEDDGSAQRMVEIARAAAQHWRDYGKVAVAAVNACFKTLDIEQRILLKLLAVYQKSERS